MSTTFTRRHRGVSFAANAVSNRRGLPRLPATDLVFAYLLRTSLEEAGKNLALLDAPAELTSSGTVSYESTHISSATNGNGLQTPHAPTESFGLVSILQPLASSSAAFIATAKSSTDWDTSVPGDRGISGIALSSVLSASIPYYDGDSGNWSTLTASATLGGATTSDWLMVASSYDADSRTLTAYAPHIGAAVSATHAEGTVIDLRGTPRNWRINRQYASSGGTTRNQAFAAFWARALTSTEIVDVIYPSLKAWMAGKGVTIL